MKTHSSDWIDALHVTLIPSQRLQNNGPSKLDGLPKALLLDPKHPHIRPKAMDMMTVGDEHAAVRLSSDAFCRLHHVAQPRIRWGNDGEQAVYHACFIVRVQVPMKEIEGGEMGDVERDDREMECCAIRAANVFRPIAAA